MAITILKYSSKGSILDTYKIQIKFKLLPSQVSIFSPFFPHLKNDLKEKILLLLIYV